MQFAENNSERVMCPVCGKNEVLIRNSRERSNPPACSRVCASSRTQLNRRYRGTASGPADRPDVISRQKWQG